jgi:peptide-methionine (R)-S-oxide reductase
MLTKLIIMNRVLFLVFAVALGAVIMVTALPLRFPLNQEGSKHNEKTKPNGVQKVTKSDTEWKQTLTPEQYRVMREKGTERPFSSPLNEEKHEGTFVCAGCGLALFNSQAKYESGSGWPSFWKPISEENVREEIDESLWQRRTEVLCARCDAHLGHVFPDGPKPTGLRYCMNGVALKFEPKDEK